jgi:hypothetical protein
VKTGEQLAGNKNKPAFPFSSLFFSLLGIDWFVFLVRRCDDTYTVLNSYRPQVQLWLRPSFRLPARRIVFSGPFSRPKFPTPFQHLNPPSPFLVPSSSRQLPLCWLLFPVDSAQPSASTSPWRRHCRSSSRSCSSSAAWASIRAPSPSTHAYDAPDQLPHCDLLLFSTLLTLTFPARDRHSNQTRLFACETRRTKPRHPKC